MFKNMHRHIPKSYKYQKRKGKATPSVKAQNAKIWTTIVYTKQGFRV